MMARHNDNGWKSGHFAWPCNGLRVADGRQLRSKQQARSPDRRIIAAHHVRTQHPIARSLADATARSRSGATERGIDSAAPANRRHLRTGCLGGNGYVNEFATGRLWRDAKLYEIGAGTSEIRRMLIGRELFAETA